MQGTIYPFLPLTDEHIRLLDLDTEDSFFKERGLLLDDGVTGIGYDRIRDIEGARCLYYLYFEEYLGSSGTVILQHILKSLPEKEYPFICIEFAITCSKMRPDNFGGGAIFITRDDIDYFNTEDWIERKVEEYKECHKPSDCPL